MSDYKYLNLLSTKMSIQTKKELLKEYDDMAVNKNDKKALDYLINYYYYIKDRKSLIKYYLLFIDRCKDDINMEIILCRIGLYYQLYEVNYDLMMKYYTMCFEVGNITSKYSVMSKVENIYYAMYNLGYYHYKNKNYDEMLKYYKMAVCDNRNKASYKLGLYYATMDINLELSNEYFIMSLYDEKTIKFYKNNVKQASMIDIDKIYDDDSLYELGNIYYKNKLYNLMIKFYNKLIKYQDGDNVSYDVYNLRLFLGDFYKKNNDYEMMKKYYLMAIDKNNKYAMFRLGYYYESIEKNYDLMKKYYEMSNYKYSFIRLSYYYKNIEHNYELYEKYSLIL